MTGLSVVTRAFVMAIAIAVSLLSPVSRADLAPNVVRVGALVPPVLISPEEGLLEGLKELGYIEGKNLVIERRLGETSEALQAGAADLVRSKVDVIVGFGTSAGRAALSATPTIPMVFISGDPVDAGLAASLARPGGQGTGVSTLSTQLVVEPQVGDPLRRKRIGLYAVRLRSGHPRHHLDRSSEMSKSGSSAIGRPPNECCGKNATRACLRIAQLE
jgi:hypothetical protein